MRFSHAFPCEPEKVTLLTPLRRGPGPDSGGRPVQNRKEGRIKALLFSVPGPFWAQTTKVQKSAFWSAKVRPREARNIQLWRPTDPV